MGIQELEELRNSNEAPYNHQEYTVWLHNKIIEKVNYDIWNFREQKADTINNTYAACNHILTLSSLKKIE